MIRGAHPYTIVEQGLNDVLFNVERVKQEDVAKIGGAPPDEAPPDEA